MDLSKPRAMVWHPEHGEKMVYLSEREEYLAKGWYKPDGKPIPAKEVEQTPEKKEPAKEPVPEIELILEIEKEVKPEQPKSQDMKEFLKSLDFGDVKDDASDLSSWLNAKYGLETNYRQGLKKLTEIANDNSVKDN